MPALLALVEAKDSFVDIVVCDVTSGEGTSSGNLQSVQSSQVLPQVDTKISRSKKLAKSSNIMIPVTLVSSESRCLEGCTKHRRTLIRPHWVPNKSLNLKQAGNTPRV